MIYIIPQLTIPGLSTTAVYSRNSTGITSKLRWPRKPLHISDLTGYHNRQYKPYSRYTHKPFHLLRFPERFLHPLFNFCNMLTSNIQLLKQKPGHSSCLIGQLFHDLPHQNSASRTEYVTYHLELTTQSVLVEHRMYPVL